MSVKPHRFELGGTRLACLRGLIASSIVLTGASHGWSQLPIQSSNELATDDVSLDSLEPLHHSVAEEYAIFSDAQHTHQLTLRPEPISQWVNVRRAGGQLGHVFVWMDGETPAALGGIFSFPWAGVMTDRRIVHEMHALAPVQLYVTRPGRESNWQPTAGLTRTAIPGVVDAVPSAARFNIVLRHVARRFSGYCVDPKGNRWELRLLPTPLMVYPLARSEHSVGFGAIMGMMGDVGSDLESGLLIEAVTESESGNASATRWTYAPLRMTDMETHLAFDDQPIWDSVRTVTDTSFYDTPHVYFRFQDRTVRLNEER